MNAWTHMIANRFQQSFYPGGLLEVLLESVLVLLVPTLICFSWRRAAAATRHLIWLAGVATLPLLLGLAVLPHTWPKPLWSVSKELNTGNQVSLTLTLMPGPAQPDLDRSGDPLVSRRPAEAVPGKPIAARVAGRWLVPAVACWAGGALLGLVWLGMGQTRLRQLAQRSQSAETLEWQSLLAAAAQSLGLRRSVRLLHGGEGVMPVTWGGRRPVVLLPAEAATWPRQRRRVVLLHELAHVKRWDCLTQTVAHAICALFWVNPLVWLAVHRMCIERERACDDLVLQSDCKASDYATELLTIARSFRPAVFAAGIGMARSARLQGRIAAMVDPNRARRLRPPMVAAILCGMAGLVACLAGTTRSSRVLSIEPAESAALWREQLTRLESFAVAKQRQSEALAAKDGESMSGQYQLCLDAAVRGDVQTVTNRYEFFKRNHGQYGGHGLDLPHAPCWQPVLEVCLAYDHLANCDPKYTKLVADGIINSIPPGSIYFGGTDPGRGLPTAFETSSIDGIPFFCLTQNALADGTYLHYLRTMYGAKIYTLTDPDSQRCFSDYLADAQRRLRHDQQFPDEPPQLKPGENVQQDRDHVRVSGQVAVMSINARLTKLLFDRNPDRQFYLEESFPLDWMYPYLEPNGLILKLNRQPLGDLSEAVLARDHDYWREITAQALGDLVNDDTSVSDLVARVQQVYVRHDLRGFTGDPAFVGNHYAKAMLSKLRASIAGVYAWRLGTNSPAEYQPKTDADLQGLLQQTDLAFRQAFALCPYSPEAVFRYVNFLVQHHRADEARLIAQTALDVETAARAAGENIRKVPGKPGFKDLLQDLETTQGQ